MDMETLTAEQRDAIERELVVDVAWEDWAGPGQAADMRASIPVKFDQPRAAHVHITSTLKEALRIAMLTRAPLKIGGRTAYIDHFTSQGLQGTIEAFAAD
jgi:hypothetical protein